MGQLEERGSVKLEALDQMVFGSRQVFLRESGFRLPKFSDSSWDLSPLEAQVHRRRPILAFGSIPPAFVLSAKQLALAQIQALPADGGNPRAPSTIVSTHYAAKAFFEWLEADEIKALGSVDKVVLARFRRHLIEKDERVSPNADAMLNTLYALREWFTDGLVTDPRPVYRSRTGRATSRENSTPRIPESVLVPLVQWSTLWVKNFSDDVIAGRDEFVALRNQCPTKAGAATSDEGHDQLVSLLNRYRNEHKSLPGWLNRDGVLSVNLSHLARQANCVLDVVQRIARAEVSEAVDTLGLDAEMSLWRKPAAELDCQTWLDTIPFWECENLVRHLMTSCYILIAMFSGMRDAEIKHLRRGCLTEERSHAGLPVRWRAQSVAFKNEPLPMGIPASWRIGELAAIAIRVLERLQPSDEELLFAEPRLQRNVRPSAASGYTRTRTAGQTTSDINEFALWVNKYCSQRNRLETIGPYDGQPWRFTTKQFRRTLAWFIARRPGGSIAGALQFRHLSVQMFEGYVGTSQSGFRAEVEGEEALVRGEYLLAMLDRHEHKDLVGPAAREGEVRLSQFRDAAAFRGVVAESPTQLARLLDGADPAVYVSDLVTCVFDPNRALCLRTKSRDAPDMARCDPFKCANVALTPSNIVAWKGVIKELDRILVSANALPPYVTMRLRETRDRVITLIDNQAKGVSA